MSGMKLINFVFVLLMAGVVIALGNLYLVNYDLFNRQVVFYGDRHIRVWALVLVSVGIGFFVNLLYNSVVALRGLVTGLNASAATRVGKRVSGHMHEARELMSHGLYAEARGVLGAVLEERADHQGANILLGEVLMKTGDTEGAVKHLEGYCMAHPDNVEARYQLAEALLANRSSDAATAVLKKIAGDHPKQALRAWRRLRALHTDAQRWDEALEAHRKLNQHFSAEMGTGEKAQGSALLYQVGLAKVEADQFKEAIQAFQLVLKEDAGFLPAQLALGRCMVLQDQEQQGVEIWLEGFRKTGEGTFLQEIEDYFIQIGKPDEVHGGAQPGRLLAHPLLLHGQDPRPPRAQRPGHERVPPAPAQPGRPQAALRVQRLRPPHPGLRGPLRELLQLEQRPLHVQGERSAGDAPADGNRELDGHGLSLAGGPDSALRLTLRFSPRPGASAPRRSSAPGSG